MLIDIIFKWLVIMNYGCKYLMSNKTLKFKKKIQPKIQKYHKIEKKNS